MSKTEVIASIAGELNSTELAVDAALTRATTLVQTMIGARAALNVSPVAGTEAQAKALEAIAALSTARLAMVACHEQLAKEHRRVGFGVYADGWKDKGQDAKTASGERLLRAV